MKARLYIFVFVLCTMSLWTFAQDDARMGERSIMGTARYVGMGGAMTAIGGDPSAVHDNPAGLGLYRRSEVLLSLDMMLDRTRQVDMALDKGKRNFFIPTQASLVVNLNNHNLMFSYHRLQSFSREFNSGAGAGPSFGALLHSANVHTIPYCTDPMNTLNVMTLKESGYVNEYGFNWGMCVSHQFYVGLGFHVQSYQYSADAVYYEQFAKSVGDTLPYDIENATAVLLSGAGCNLSLGLIYRPLSWLRLGLGIHTPSLGTLTTSTAGVLSAQTDTLIFGDEFTTQKRNTNFHMPMHLSTSAAFQIGAYGMLAFQYDYWLQQNGPDRHSLRAGIEVIPVLGFYINAGYAYESSFQHQAPVREMDRTFERQDTYTVFPRWSQYVSAAIGYRGADMIVQAAYQYRWQRVHMYPFETASPYAMNTDTHRIVLTIGWHHN